MSQALRALTPTRPVWVEHRTAPVSSCRAPAVHEHVALAFFTSGRAAVEQGGRFEVREGDVLLVPAGAPHWLSYGRDTAAWGIGFCGTCYAPSELGPLLEPFERARAGGSAVVAIPGDRQEHVARLCRELADETRSDGAARAHGAWVQKGLLGLVLAEVARAAPTTAPAESTSVVGAALQFIERHCLSSISLRDVAAAVGRSPSYVTTAVKRATGKTVGEWIIAGRLAEARNRLVYRDERVDEIAERVGYADVTHFIRLFRRAHGVTPAAWRAAQRAALNRAESRA